MATVLVSRRERRQMGAGLRLEFQREASRLEGSLRKQLPEGCRALFEWSFAFWVSGTLCALGANVR